MKNIQEKRKEKNTLYNGENKKNEKDKNRKLYFERKNEMT